MTVARTPGTPDGGAVRAPFRPALRLVVPAALGCALIASQLIIERLGAGDDVLRAQLDAQRATVAALVQRAARARVFDAAAGAGLDAVSTAPLAASRAASAFSIAVAPWAASADTGLAVRALAASWDGVGAALEAARSVVGARVALGETATGLEARIARLLVDSARLVEVLGAADGEPEQVRAAIRQRLLAQRLESVARRLLSDRDGLLGAADRLGRDTIVFGEVNNALQSGNAALGLPRVVDLDARALLERLGREWRDATTAVERIVGLASNGAEADAAVTVLEHSLALTVAAIDAVDAAWRAARAARRITPALQRLGLGLLVLAVLASTLASVRDARRALGVEAGRRRAELERAAADAARAEREADAEAHAAREAEALAALADGLEAWARGVLSAPIDGLETLPPDLARAVASVRESLGPTVEALREHSLDLGTLASSARTSASRVAGMADDQSARLGDLARAAREMTGTLEPLAARAGETASRVARDDAGTAAAVRAARDALDGVDGAHAAVTESAARLGHASDELGALRDLAELLDELADGSKLLSVNVAIQASMDTESGRALANFADEVQRVSDRARQAVRRVEGADEVLRRALGEAVASMKRGRWALDSAAGRGRLARPALEVLGRDVSGADAVRAALDDAVRAHTVAVTEMVRGLRGVQTLAVEIRDGAFAASDSSARVRDSAHVAARTAERLEVGVDGGAEVFEIGAGEPERESIVNRQLNVLAMRSPEPPAGG